MGREIGRDRGIYGFDRQVINRYTYIHRWFPYADTGSEIKVY